MYWISPNIPHSRESAALLLQSKTPELKSAGKARPPYNIPLRGPFCLTTSFPWLLASVNIYGQAAVRFWHHHMCSWVLCTGLSCREFSGGKEIEPQMPLLPCWAASFFSTVCLSFYFTSVPSCYFISKSSSKFTLLTENPQNETNSIPTHLSPTALFTLWNTSAFSMGKFKIKSMFNELPEQEYKVSRSASPNGFPK